MKTYKIVRFTFGKTRRKVIKTGLTLEQAQAHCHSPETSSRTAKRKGRGHWFDGYQEEVHAQAT